MDSRQIPADYDTNPNLFEGLGIVRNRFICTPQICSFRAFPVGANYHPCRRCGWRGWAGLWMEWAGVAVAATSLIGPASAADLSIRTYPNAERGERQHVPFWDNIFPAVPTLPAGSPPTQMKDPKWRSVSEWLASNRSSFSSPISSEGDSAFFVG